MSRRRTPADRRADPAATSRDLAFTIAVGAGPIGQRLRELRDGGVQARPPGAT